MRGGRGVLLVSMVCAHGCLIENPAWVDVADSGSETGVAPEVTSSTTETTSGPPATTASVTTEAMVTSDTEVEEASSSSTGDDITPPPENELCSLLPAANEDAIRVNARMATAAIRDTIAGLRDGQTVVFEAGVYDLRTETLAVATPNVILRSEDGDPSSVTLSGGGVAESIIEIQASGVLVAGMTLDEPRVTGIRLGTSSGAISGITLRNLAFVDNGSHGIQSFADVNGPGNWVDDVEVSCSSFQLSAEFQQLDTCGSQGAISVNAVDGWQIRDNYFAGYLCRNGGQASVVRITDGSRNTIIERNRLDSVYRGIVLGGQDPNPLRGPAPIEARAYEDNPCGAGEYWGHIGGVIRNNMFWNGADDILNSQPTAGPQGRVDTMISFWRVCGAIAANNTIIGLVPGEFVYSAVEYRYPGTAVSLFNNLSNYEMRQRKGAVLSAEASNMFGELENVVSDALTGDLSLYEASTARGQGVRLREVTDDFDGEPRGMMPDVGADEFMAR